MEKTLVIGSCTVDIVIPTPRLPSTTDSINSGVHHYALGGCAYNVSQMLRLLSVPYLHGVTIGSGIYGDFVKKELEKKGIPIFRTSSEPHGACICLVEERGERSFIAYHGIEYKFNREWFKSFDLSTFSNVYLCGLELEEDTGEEIVKFLEENRFKNIYFAPGPRLLTIKEDFVKRIFALNPIIHLNDQEIISYTDSDIERAMKTLRSMTGNDVIVTMGKDGASILTGDDFIYEKSRESEVVDSIGAGDCHLGTYISFRSMGKDKREALKKANLFASEVVRHEGSTLREEDITTLL
ncbi:MAG: PfkB family carbohydrate kinase [Spirochaetales bacterium]|nr:PfkB family carbohydrate kinase [Spirochaetales bacterium]